MNQDLISIIIPVYDMEGTLKETVDSIINQTYTNWELIIVNDGSKDNSLAVAKELERKDNRIKVIDKVNGGVSSARNTGLRFATGVYVAFCDADDICSNLLLEELYTGMQRCDADWVCGSCTMFSDYKHFPRRSRLVNGINLHENLIDSIVDDGTLSGILISSVFCMLYKRLILEENEIYFNESIRTNEDGLFNINYFIHTKKILKINNSLYYVRIPTQDTPEKIRYQLASLEDIFSPATKEIEVILNGVVHNLEEQLKARKISVSLWLILIACQKFERKRAIAEIEKILHTDGLSECYCFVKPANLEKKKLIFYILMKMKCAKILHILSGIYARRGRK